MSLLLVLSSGGVNYDLIGNSGTFVVAGNNATVTKSNYVNASAGTYTINGQAQTLLHTSVVVANTGAYALSGTNVLLYKNNALNSVYGNYNVVGNAALITYGISYVLVANNGAYNLSGQLADILYTPVSSSAYELIANTGSYATSFNSAIVYRKEITKNFYVEGVKVKKKVTEEVKEDIIDYDEEIAILMLMAA